jgi:hypothetical protein
MTISKENFKSAVQKALPQAKVTWKKEPDWLHPESECTLTAISLTNPEHVSTLTLKDGFKFPPFDNLVEDFLQQFLFADPERKK